MGFLGRGLGTAFGGGLGYVIGNQFDQNKGGGASGPAPWNPLTAKKVGITPDLAATMGTIGTDAYNKIGSNYGGAKTELAKDAAVRGLPARSNSYAAERLPVAQGLDVGNLQSAVGGQLGETAYKNALKDREYGQNLSLVDQIAALNKPSLLDEIFKGIGAVGKPVGTYAGLSRRGGGGGWGSSSSPTVGSPYDYMDVG